MNKAYNVLIIDDHQIIIDTYKNALNYVEENTKNIHFNIYEATDCDSAYAQFKELAENNKVDIVFLDIQLPHSSDKEILSGEDLGVKIKELLPDVKIIVCTNLNDNIRLRNILKTINPDSFLIKSDIVFNDLITSIKKVLENKIFYSHTVINLMKNSIFNSTCLDEHDIKILYEISNGSRMKELTEIIPLSKASIEKRKKALKSYFNVKRNSDRDLILEAKRKGFI